MRRITTILNLNCGYDWKEDAINIDTEGENVNITLDMSEPCEISIKSKPLSGMGIYI